MCIHTVLLIFLFLECLFSLLTYLWLVYICLIDYNINGIVCTFVSAGFGVEQLRDDRMDTYWQSDGQLPHLVNVQFQRKTTISDIYIYTDYKLDESYTPSRISVRVGTHFNDLQEIEVAILTEPTGLPSDSVK